MRYLVRMIDDATSWSWGRFVEQRRDAGEHGRAVGVRGAERADGGCVHGPRFDVHGAAAGRGERAAAARGGPSDADWAAALRELGIGWIWRTRRKPRGAWSAVSGPIRIAW